VVVTHVKRAASRHSPKAQIEFYRAMDIFYHKFYANSTPFWLHGLILTGINLPWRYSQLKYRLSLFFKANAFNSNHSAEVQR
jgi:hypothetical protein